jgi:tetratricopeptide (TPR) repeat protein
MKKYFLLGLSLALCCQFAAAQSKGKAKEKDKPPTQKEIDEMMKEMQGMMNDADPETKKTMDSMGIKMPDPRSISKFTDKQYKDAWENENRIIPVKDAARIAIASSVMLSDAAIPAYTQKTFTAVGMKLSAEVKTKATEIYQSYKAQGATAIDKAAAGLWFYGKPSLALYMMAMACKDDPSNTDHLNNYASMLTMCGGEELALPILNNLNKRFPRNSTILNNIGQAWFGLGELDKAGKYLDSTIRIYAYHPQANIAKSHIEEGKGNKTGAIEAMKRAIKNGYSASKANRLRSLGYKLKNDDLNWDHPMPQDPMGLEKFKWPDYPQDVNFSPVLEKEWATFKARCSQELLKLTAKQRKLEQDLPRQVLERTKLIMQASQAGKRTEAVPAYAGKAAIKLNYLIDDKDGGAAFQMQKGQEDLARANEKVGDYEKRFEIEQKMIDKKYENLIGEGKPNPLAAICSDENNIRNKFLGDANGSLRHATNAYLENLRHYLNNLVYYKQYTAWPEDFELTKVIAQVRWLTSIRDQKVLFRNKSNWCSAVKDPKGDTTALQHFDDVACKYTSTLNLGFGSITSQCSRLIVNMDIGGLKFNMKEDSYENRIISGSAEIGISKSIGATKGPIGAELTANAAVGVEFDNSGITDVIGKVGAEATVAGQTIGSIEGKISINSGPSMEGKSILSK